MCQVGNSMKEVNMFNCLVNGDITFIFYFYPDTLIYYISKNFLSAANTVIRPSTEHN